MAPQETNPKTRTRVIAEFWLRTVCFLLVCTLVLGYTLYVLTPKDDYGICSIVNYYQQPSDTVDVLVLGTSVAYSGVNTNVLWEDYGLAVYDLCGAEMPYWAIYYYLQEALKTQRPKLILLDAKPAIYSQPYSKKARVIVSTYGILSPENRFGSIIASTHPDNTLDFCVGFSKIHNRYPEITAEDFLYPTDNGGRGSTWKGYIEMNATDWFFAPDVDWTKDTRKSLQEKQQIYFEKILQTAKREKIPLVLVGFPNPDYAYACLDIAGYNYGVYRYEKDLKKYPERLILGSETFCKDVWRFQNLAEKNPRLIGDFVWSGIDYLGEVGLGAWEYPEYAPLPLQPGWISSGCGRIDLAGNLLGEANYINIAFGNAQSPRMAVQPIHPKHEKHSPSAWKMSNALTTWSWRGCDGETAHVEVYSRGAQVILRLNDTVVGKKAVPRNHIVRFTVPWHPGVLTASALDEQGALIGTCQLQSLGKETFLSVLPEKQAASPGELCFIRLRYTDEHDDVLPRTRGVLQVAVEGGELLGLGSACPYNPLGFTTDRTDTYYGEALAAVRAGKDGQIRIRATDGTYTGNGTIPILEPLEKG